MADEKTAPATPAKDTTAAAAAGAVPAKAEATPAAPVVAQTATSSAKSTVLTAAAPEKPAEPKAEAAPEAAATDKAAGDQAKPGEAEKKPEEAAAEVKYDLKLPEGSLVAEAEVQDIVAFAKERKMSNDQAQAVLERISADRKAFVDANKPGGSEWARRVDAFEAEALAEIGKGDPKALAAEAELARRAFVHAPKEVRDFLQESGYGSNAKVIKMFATFARMMAEDRAVVPTATAGGSADLPLEARLFPLSELQPNEVTE